MLCPLAHRFDFREILSIRGAAASAYAIFFVLFDALVHLMQGMKDNRPFSMASLLDLETMIGLGCLAFQWSH